ncbi:MAG: uroporphyrinogen-III synthase [Thermoanaerobaculia bacterium]
MRRVLLLRPTGGPVAGADLLVTHRVVPVPAALAETEAYDPEGAILVVSSLNAVEILGGAPAGDLLARPFRLVLSAGAGTARALAAAGVAGAVAPEPPGAAGILAELARREEGGRLLWPRGSDADAAPLTALAERGFEVTAPVVYRKEPLAALDARTLSAFRAGEYDALAIGSIAALDVFLAALGAREARELPPVRFGVLGPETARLLVARGFPEPLVPAKPLLTDLIALLKEA